MEASYVHAPVPVRADIQLAHTTIWQKLAEPGTWWTGAERVAIAAEVRKAYTCQLCAARKAALSPSAVEGLHDTTGFVSEVMLEMIHRITTDPGRLSKEWYEQLAAQGLQDTHYVEALGVLVRTISIDTFCRALDVPLHPLPPPVSGAPSQYRPPLAQHNGEWGPHVSTRRGARSRCGPLRRSCRGTRLARAQPCAGRSAFVDLHPAPSPIYGPVSRQRPRL